MLNCSMLSHYIWQYKKMAVMTLHNQTGRWGVLFLVLAVAKHVAQLTATVGGASPRRSSSYEPSLQAI